jgi:Ca2+-binding RTX toxin-like protein
LVAAVAIVVPLAVPALASPAGQISIHGADQSVRLTLSVDHGDLLAHGPMDRSQTYGCRFTRQYSAVCPLDQIDSIQVVMGRYDDKVVALDPLPVPLTAYLGNGSDKLIGNDEPDTCYSQGAKKNRCLGHGGDDICITGPRNSDCVGGPGNDFCQHSTGSDGCWGNEGDDVCYMGPGMDGCHGGPGNDRLFGGADPDQLYGGPGRDYCDGGPGVGRSHTCETGPGH